MDSVVANRAMQLSEEDALEGHTTISLETCGELIDKADKYTLTYIQENFADFLKYLRFLKKEDQELLLSYYILAKTQNTLALIHKSTQTVCSFRLRMAAKTLGAFILMGEPTPEKMHEILEKAGLEGSLKKTPLSQIIDEYSRCRNFQRIAEVHKLHRPDIRRAMSRASKQLIETKDQHQHALGAYIHSLIDKSNPAGVGYSKRKIAKMCHIYLRDADCLGQFRIDVEDPYFSSWFVSRANR